METRTDEASWHHSPADYRRSQQWARNLLASTSWVILDTETTGLHDQAEAVQIGVIGPDGAVLFSSLLHPKGAIPADAIAIHGITDEKVASAPTFAEIRGQLADLLTGRKVISYNADFDARILRQTAEAHGVPLLELEWDCAMEWYAAWYGSERTHDGQGPLHPTPLHDRGRAESCPSPFPGSGSLPSRGA